MLKNYDIVIVGGGPTGSMASLLCEKRIKCFDWKKFSTLSASWAIALNGYSLSIIKHLLDDQWENFEFTVAVEVGYVLSKDKMDEPFGKMQPPVIDGKVLDLDNYGFLNWFNQPQLEGLLRLKMENNSNIDCYYNHSAIVMYGDDKNYLKIQNHDNNVIAEISSKYLIGADGGLH